MPRVFLFVLVITRKQLEAAAALVQRNVAHSQQQEGHVAITHEPDDAPPPKQEVSSRFR